MYGRNSSSILWIVVLELQHNKPTTDGIEDTTTAHHKGLKHPGILYYLYQKKEKHNNKAVNQSNAEKQT
ncbi:unnamed protein product [Musa acuminata var. zebrina]